MVRVFLRRSSCNEMRQRRCTFRIINLQDYYAFHSRSKLYGIHGLHKLSKLEENEDLSIISVILESLILLK